LYTLLEMICEAVHKNNIISTHTRARTHTYIYIYIHTHTHTLKKRFLLRFHSRQIW